MGEHATSWWRSSGLAIALACGAASQAVAQQPTQADAQDNAWRFQLTPYVWMTGMGGYIKPLRSGPTAHVEQSFSDVFSDLEAAFFLTGTARKDRWVVHGDLSYASTSDQKGLPLRLMAKTSVRQSSATVLAGYQWLETARSSMDVMAGLRFWNIKAALAIDGFGSVQSRAVFTDPVLSARWRYELAPQWSSIVYADVGGFGVGSQSTWQGMAAVNYQWRDDVFFSLGYRYLKVDYRRNGKRLDFNQSGPLLGATFRF